MSTEWSSQCGPSSSYCFLFLSVVKAASPLSISWASSPTKTVFPEPARSVCSVSPHKTALHSSSNARGKRQNGFALEQVGAESGEGIRVGPRVDITNIDVNDVLVKWNLIKFYPNRFSFTFLSRRRKKWRRYARVDRTFIDQGRVLVTGFRADGACRSVNRFPLWFN